MISKYDNEIRLEFVSKSCNEAFARIAVAAFASQLDPTIEEIADIKTAVSEAVTNSIIHGYEDTMGIIKLHCMIKENNLIIEISDNGVGIEDINAATAILANASLFDLLKNSIFISLSYMLFILHLLFSHWDQVFLAGF